MTIKDLLKEHNDFATTRGWSIIKSWKQSKAKLQEKIDAMRNKATEIDKINHGKRVKKNTKKTSTKKPAVKKVTKPKATNDKDHITMSQLLDDLGFIDSHKVPRAKLRRHGVRCPEGHRHWPAIKIGSDTHTNITEILSK